MKITVLYGQDLNKLIARKNQIIKAIQARGWEIQTLQKDGKSLAEKLRSTSLFESQKLFIIDEISQLSSKDLDWLKKNQSLEVNLLIVVEGNLPVKVKNALGKDAKLESFDLPQKIFVFLDSLFPKNASKSISLFHEVTENEPVELIFAMIATHFRDLYWVSKDPNSYKSPPWRVNKLKFQATKFSEESLKQIINKLANIDIQSKTSQANLSQSLDLLIATSLK